MIEPLPRFPRVHGNETDLAGEDIIDLHEKVNQLVEASNRQDRAIARLLGHTFRNGVTNQMREDDAYFIALGEDISNGK